MQLVVTTEQCDADSSNQCSEEMKRNIAQLNYAEHSSGVVSLTTANTAGAQAWADAAASGKSERERVSAAEKKFEKFAPKALFDKASVQRLAQAKESGEATQIWKSKDMVTTLLKLKAKEEGGCNEVASQIEAAKKLILSVADISPTDEKAMSVIRAEASDKRSCDAIFRTRVDAGKVDDFSKDIITRYERDTVRRRRLGGGGTSAEISAGASEEEVKVGDKPKWTDFSSPSANKAGGEDENDDDDDDDDDMQTFLNSSGMVLESNFMAVILAMSLGMFANMF